MRRRVAIGLVVALLVSLLTVSASTRSNATFSQAVVAPRVRADLDRLGPGEMTTVIVTLRDQADLSELPSSGGPARQRRVVRALRARADASQVGLESLLRMRAARGTVASFTPLWITNAISVTATANVIRELAGRVDVAKVSSDRVRIVPTVGTPESGVAQIDAPSLWNLGYTGEGVVVATLDSGVDITNPDLAASWRGGTNSWFDPYGQHLAGPVDLSGHGTGTMGVILGGDSGGTSIGVAPGARWIAARIFNDAGGSTVTAIHAAFQWLLDPDGDPGTADAPDIVNNSWSYGTGPGCNLAFQPDFQALRAAGIVPVVSAGNFGSGTGSSVSPANYPEALAVGAVNGSDAIYPSSGRGPSACGEPSTIYPEIVAPGVSITTSDRFGTFQTASGTSLAAPHVSGALALLLSSHPALTATDAEAAVLGTATDLGAAGPDDTYGNGRLDVLAAYRSLPAAHLFLSTKGNGSIPGVSGPYDDSDIYGWDGAAFTREWDATAGGNRLPGSADVDGYDRVDASHFYVSFTDATTVPGIAATVQDEDVAYFNGDHWELYFDGSAVGLDASANLDLDAIDVVGGTLYFSTIGNTNPPGVSRTPDNADIYSWDGTGFTRVWDATANGLPRGANVDGFVRVTSNRFYLSFTSAGTAVPGLGTVQDEDVVFDDAGAWSVYFDGTANGLGSSGAQDVDAFDL